ncbi:MAG: hypothetical protein IAE97_00280 [Chthoniobacterales bacterium]|nr:hypothetical protein [Chthoniobacterales bacterium]
MKPSVARKRHALRELALSRGWGDFTVHSGKRLRFGTPGAFGKSRTNRFFSRHKVTLAMQCALAEAQLINLARAKAGMPWLTKDERMAIYERMRAIHGDKLVTTTIPKK